MIGAFPNFLSRPGWGRATSEDIRRSSAVGVSKVENSKKTARFIVQASHSTRVSLLMGWLIMCVTLESYAVEKIQLNQIGFPPEASKIAVVPNVQASTFRIVDTHTGKVAFESTLTDARYWDLAEETVKLADFSGFQAPGTYRLDVTDAESSYPFVIADNVYRDALAASIKAFYFNRAGATLESRHAGKFARPAGHPDVLVYVHASAADEQRPEGTVLSSPKGWYDAGDFNKYIVNSGITMFTLLKTLSHHTESLETLGLNIPESGNRLPDLVNEMLWNLDWMESMQDPHDGGVYHKLTTKHFAKKEMPHIQTAPRYVVQKSTAATLDFASVMALAARVLRPYSKQLDGRVLRYQKAAKLAWKWARKHPKQFYQQPEDIFTGKYAFPDETLEDEWQWAACELFILTGQPQYRKHIVIPDIAQVPGWSKVATLGLFSLMDASAGDVSLRRRATRAVLALADQLVKEHNNTAYAVAMTRGDYIWGSNSEALNKGIVLAYANRIQPNHGYLVAMQSLLDYVLGRNPTGYSFMTGFGSKPPMGIHHRVSQSDGIADPIPGFLAGGPQPGWQDSCKYSTRIPAKTYVDDWCSYSTNEVAINWNAPLVYMLAALNR
ncbi:MAG: glycoside hydrolase family 9 protein [Deltaproteobacteria bacterium]|nr:glycoside hydrolase family 9 protein [Deltaproteobacteria bacterium]